MIFLDLYFKFCIFFDFYYKINLCIFLYFYSFIFIKFIEFFSYNTYVFSRFFRNIRMNFSFFSIIALTEVRKYLNNRKEIKNLNIFFSHFAGLFFFFNLEYLFFETFRVLFRYNLCFLGFGSNQKNLFLLSWNDIYSVLNDFNDMIVYRDSFLFKFDLPHIIYNLYLYFYNFKVLLLYLSFFGYRFFFKKRYFRFKFFIKIF